MSLHLRRIGGISEEEHAAEVDMSPEVEAIGMVIPDVFRLQVSRPAAALDSSLVTRGGVVWWPDHSHESGARRRFVRLPCASSRRSKCAEHEATVRRIPHGNKRGGR